MISWTGVGSTLTAIIKNIPGDKAKELLDTIIDKLEEIIDESDTKVDDALLKPLLLALRRMVGIEEKEGSKYEDK